MQRKSAGTNKNMLEHPRRLHQLPAAQLAQELKSIAVDWAVGLHRNSPCDESPAYLTTLLDAANSAAAPFLQVASR